MIIKNQISVLLEEFKISSGYDKNSLANAKNKVNSLRSELNGENPILVIHPSANSYCSFSDIIKKPYVKSYSIGSSSFNHYVLFVNGSVSIPVRGLDNYLKPLDIVKIEKISKWGASAIGGDRYYHFGIYLGKDQIFHLYHYSSP